MVKVLDFGIAMALPTGGAGVVTTTIGSPFWMAPEQAKPGAVLAPSTDVWALGLIAYQLLAGGSYWRTAKVEDVAIGAVLTEILVEPMSSASERAAELGQARLPVGFDGWFARCLCREQSGRYVDAKACLDGLDELLAKTAPRAAVTFSNGELQPVVPAAPFEATMQRATPYPQMAEELAAAPKSVSADTKPSLMPVAPVLLQPAASSADTRPSLVPVAPLLPVAGASATANTKPSLSPVSSAPPVEPALMAASAVAVTKPSLSPVSSAPPVGPASLAPVQSQPRSSMNAGVFIGIAGVLVAVGAVWWSQRAASAPVAPKDEVAVAPSLVAPKPVVVDPVVAALDPTKTQEPTEKSEPIKEPAPPAPRPRPRPAPAPVADGPFSAMKVTGETCPTRHVSFDEAAAHRDELCKQLDEWDIARIGGGGSMNGRGYGCKVQRSDPSRLGHSLCRR